MSPTPLNWIEGDAVSMAKGETLKLRYRVVVHAGELPRETLERCFAEWTAKP
jgi:hypothetical protein